MGDARDGRCDNRGFTMIEVMVALVIVLIALDVLFSGIATSLGTARSTAVWARAISRAESHLTAVTDPSQILGEREGEDQ